MGDNEPQKAASFTQLYTCVDKKGWSAWMLKFIAKH